jgi:ABC-2 type transport system permease protein
MKLTSVIKKSAREQTRQFWILFLTISMAPFFVLVYYLINETSKPHYDVLVVNEDRGLATSTEELLYGDILLENIATLEQSGIDIPLTIKVSENRSSAITQLKGKKADALVIIPEGFSQRFHALIQGGANEGLDIEFMGDLTNINYAVSAVWVNEVVNEYVHQVTGVPRPVSIIETGLGVSGNIDDFDLYIPGILILSVIMLMFSATIAIVTEVEHKTIIRLKLSKLTAIEYLSGVSAVQVLIGVISVILTLLVAVVLGFDFSGSIALLIFIAVLTSISMIAFSLIVAALTKSVNEVLVVGNFPLFLFMFFTGAAFPIKGTALFSLAGYPITLQGLMSPTHAISALNKVLIMRMGLKDILPEMIALTAITIVYFATGVWAFRRRHMKVE